MIVDSYMDAATSEIRDEWERSVQFVLLNKFEVTVRERILQASKHLRVSQEILSGNAS